MRQLTPEEKHEVLRLVEALVTGDYGGIVQDGRNGRLHPDDIERVMRDYEDDYVVPPDEVWQVADTYEVLGDRDHLVIDLPLWTRAEGRSDLCLVLDVRQSRTPMVVIDDLLVP